MRYVVVAPELLAAALDAPQDEPVARVLTICAYSAALDKLEIATDPELDIWGWDHDTSKARAVCAILTEELPVQAPPDWALVVPPSLRRATSDLQTRTAHGYGASARTSAWHELLVGCVPSAEALDEGAARYATARSPQAWLDPLMVAAHAAVITSGNVRGAHAVVLTDRVDATRRWVRAAQQRTRQSCRRAWQAGRGPNFFARSLVDRLTVAEFASFSHSAAGQGFDLDAVPQTLFAQILEVAAHA